MGAGLLVDYFNRHGAKAEILPDLVTQKTKEGKRLDRWLKVAKGKRITYYQVEIKNWAASAIGGRVLPIHATPQQVREHKIERWSREWNGKTFIKDAVRKVLTPMKPPDGAMYVEPLACFWDAMHPTGKSQALFSVSVSGGKFDRVWVFSMSAHLRNLQAAGLNFVRIDAPAIKTRVELLNNLFGR
jgi:hypothetical protein